MANYGFVVDSTFSPFSMQEMLVPFTAYKDAFEKSEEAYNDLSDKSDKFKYLSETLPEGSKARQLYEGYANDLAKQAEDLAHNGLTMGNRRALTSMKRRYQGEIGRIMQADEAMREERKLRQSLNAQDSSRLYATDNLSIDDFLDGGSPNLYSISGNELYTRGAAAGKAASSRVFSAGDAGSTLNGYYRDYVQKMGYNRDTIQKFYQDMSTIPELQMAADAILEERGVNQNLTGVNLQRARQSVINGMIDGAVYQENHSPQRDLGVLTKAEQVADARAKEQMKFTAMSNGFEKVGNSWRYNPSLDPRVQQATAVAQAKKGANNSSGSSGGGGKYPGYTDRMYMSYNNKWKGKKVDDISDQAAKVTITPSGDQYILTIGEGEDKMELGRITTDGKFTKPTYEKFGKNFDSEMSWYQRGPTYDRQYDDANAEALAKDVLDVVRREGGKAYKNYDYYYEPDNVKWSNGSGGFYRDPRPRVAGTVFNENLEDFDPGYGDKGM